MNLFYAAQMGNFENIKQGVMEGGDVNGLYQVGNIRAAPLYVAAQNNHTIIVEFLVKNGAKVNTALEDGATALFIACLNGHSQVVKTLLKLGADPEIPKGIHKPIDVAIYNNDIKTAKYLTQAGVKVEYIRNFDKLVSSLEESSQEELFFNNLLLKSINLGYSDLAKELISIGNNFEFMSLNGLYPLYAATQAKNFEVTKSLLLNGANPNPSLFSGSTPIYLSSKQGDTSMVALLLNYGAKSGIEEIQVAAGNGHTETAMLLMNGIGEFCNKHNDKQMDKDLAGVCFEYSLEQ